MSDDVQRGRYLLFEKVVDEASIQSLSSQDYGDINRALAAFNLLGLYVQKGHVEKKEVMDVWARPVYRSWVAAQPFFAHREQNAGYRLGGFFEQLAQQARVELICKGETAEYSVWHHAPASEQLAENYAKGAPTPRPTQLDPVLTLPNEPTNQVLAQEVQGQYLG
jgi:hypothetical protein